MGLVQNLQSITNVGGANGNVIDTDGITRLVYEVRWSFASAPSALVFNPVGSNDAGAAPDVWFGDFETSGPNLTKVGDEAQGALQASGRGLLILRGMARFTAVNTYFTGTTGIVTLRAFGC